MLALVLLTLNVQADGGVLSDNLRIESQHLGYALQYRVYTPTGASATDQLPSLYVTDGPAYLGHGNFKQVLDAAIVAGEIKPLVVVFVDSRNPDNLEENRRTAEFM